MENFLECLFPSKCLACGNTESLICRNCIRKLKMICTTACFTCGSDNFTGQTHKHCIGYGYPKHIFSFYDYEGIVRKAIKLAKYNKKQFCYMRYITKVGIQEAKRNGYFIERNHVLVPIPLHKNRQQARGFNQAKIIAQELSRVFEIEVEEKALYRIKDTPQLVSRNRKERYESIADAFITGEITGLRNKNIILVDDVCTSGATLVEATRAFAQINMHNVSCITLARKFID